jgi:histidinol dehydrogenase
MKTYINPSGDQWKALVQRPELELDYLDSTVKNIIARVKKSGDYALKEFSAQFDKVKLESLEVSKEEIQQAIQSTSAELKAAIQAAYQNIFKFHEAQQSPVLTVKTMSGVICERRSVAIEKVGIYIPGGSAPLFSTVLMLGVPAKIAGCKEMILCTPPASDGSVNPAILFTARLVGVTKIFKVGGAQAIAALAYGTETIPAVDKIFGPGNQYVTKAKQLVSMDGVAIDMPAGPSEVLVYADGQANPAFIAADLLSQAEHGTDSQVVLVTNSNELIAKVSKEIDAQVKNLPRQEIAQECLKNSLFIQFDDLNSGFDFINAYAPEHLIINASNPRELTNRVINAGSVFIGEFTPEAAGDYASGTNHTLPTNGFARAYSGVSLSSFQKHITFQEITRDGLRALGPIVETMAAAENLIGHKNAITVRLKSLN